MSRLLPAAPILLCLAGAQAATVAIERHDITIAEASGIVAANVSIHEGQWETEGRMVDYDVPVLPADDAFVRAVVQRIRARLAGGVTIRGAACVRPRSPENPLLAIPGVDPTQCRVARFRMVGGTVNMTLSCTRSAQMSAAQIEMETRYEPERITVDSHSTTTMVLTPTATPRQARTHSLTTMRRIGDCAAGQ